MREINKREFIKESCLIGLLGFVKLAFPKFLASAWASDDNFPLELGKREYDVKVNVLGGIIGGKVNLELGKENNAYYVHLFIKSSPLIALIGSFNHSYQSRLESTLTKDKSYRSLEYNTEKNSRTKFIIPDHKKERYIFQYPEESNKTILKVGKKTSMFPINSLPKCEEGTNVSLDTQDPLTLVVNLLSKDYSESGNYYLGKIKGNNKIEPVDIYANIVRKGNHYTTKLTFPKGIFFDDSDAPFEMDYIKKNGKVKLLRLDLLIKPYIDSWARAIIKNK